MIYYLRQHEIDKAKWDECIDRSPNGLVYAYSWYLDSMTTCWDALVEDDYVSVFPLPWKQKYFIKYICQPPITQQLGLFSTRATDSRLVEEFISKIPRKFILVDINLNAKSRVVNVPATGRKNYVLKLDSTYGDIFKNRFDRNHQRNIKKASEAGLSVSHDDSTTAIIDFYINLLDKNTAYTTRANDFDRLKSAFRHAEALGMTEKLSLYHDGEMVASCLLFKSHNRLYYVVGGSDNKGKTMGTTHYLIDRIINKYAGTSFDFDFEGSEIKNVAIFNGRFGAIPEYYYHIKISRLPIGKFW